MSDTSSIEWTEATLNPWTGCTKISPGCAHCYIASTPPFRINHRRFVGGHIPLVFHMDRLDRMVRRRRPTLYFVNSLSDLFHEDASDEQIAQVFAAMALAPRHTFQVLTKRPDRMRDLLKSWRFCKLTMQAIFDTARRHGIPNAHVMADVINEEGFAQLDNIWLGVTVENRRFVSRADVLRATPAAVRFISAEPLLGPLVPDAHHNGVYWQRGWHPTVSRQGWRRGMREPDRANAVNAEPGPSGLDLTGIDWLIVGGESGKGYRPFDVQWARDLRDVSQSTGTAFFVKQTGGARPGTALEDLPADLQIRDFPR